MARGRTKWQPGGRRHVPAHGPPRPDPANEKPDIWSPSAPPGAFRTDDGGETWRPINRGLSVRVHPRPGRPTSATASTTSPCIPARPDVPVHAEALGRDAVRRRRRELAGGQRQPAVGLRVRRSTSTPTSRRRSTSCRSRATRNTTRSEGKLRVYRSRCGGDEWEPLTVRPAPAGTATSTSSATPCRSTTLDPCGLYVGTTGGQVYASPDARRLVAGRSSATCRPCCRSRCRTLP